MRLAAAIGAILLEAGLPSGLMVAGSLALEGLLSRFSEGKPHQHIAGQDLQLQGVQGMVASQSREGISNEGNRDH